METPSERNRRKRLPEVRTRSMPAYRLFSFFHERKSRNPASIEARRVIADRFELNDKRSSDDFPFQTMHIYP